MKVRMSHAPKNVKFIYDEDSARVRAMFIHDNVMVADKWLTADEEECIVAIHPDIYDFEEYAVNAKELTETDFMFESVDGDDCNFIIMLHELSVR